MTFFAIIWILLQLSLLATMVSYVVNTIFGVLATTFRTMFQQVAAYPSWIVEIAISLWILATIDYFDIFKIDFGVL